jgi:glycolate oxidase
MRRILEVDVENQRVVVEPGVVNLWVTEEVAEEGYYYVPDPSSQVVSSIGGNLAENSGGVHCLKYGFTTNHVTGAEVVLPDGSVTHLGGGKSPDAPGYDLLGALVGSEGTLGIATKITLRICRKPESVRTLLAAFADTEKAGGAVSGIIGEGIIPAGIEMMDELCLEAVEKAVHPNFPPAGAILIVELDGPTTDVEHQFGQVERICEENGATEIRVAEDDDERALFWKGRKAAFAAMGRIAKDYYVQDGVVPRTELPAVVKEISELSAQYGMRVANVFHAGDGNLHPLVLYDGSVEGEDERAEELAGEIVFACLEHGGSLTGEHGIGVGKRDHLVDEHGDAGVDLMRRVKRAFDPEGVLNPGKVLPDAPSDQ